MKRTIRISVNGVFQFAARVDQDIELEEIAVRAHREMRLSDAVVAHISTGQINFIPRPVQP